MIETKNIRNVVVLGHQGSGKSSLIASLAYKSGYFSKECKSKEDVISKLFSSKTIETTNSINITSLEYNDYKINLIDVPGNDDYIFETLGITKLVKGAILVIDASKQVEIGTIKHFKLLQKRGIPTFIYINKMDKENINYDEVYMDILDKLSSDKVIQFSYPLGKEQTFDGFINTVTLKARRYNGNVCVDESVFDDKKHKIFSIHNKLLEQVATTSDELLDKYFEGKGLTLEEIKQGLRTAVISGDLYPVLVGSALKDICSNTLLEMIVNYLPSPNDLEAYSVIDVKTNAETKLKTESTAKDVSAYIFKIKYDQYKGMICYAKVLSGVLKQGMTLINSSNNKEIKNYNLMSLQYTNMVEIDEVVAGDICVLTKLENVRLNDTLCFGSLIELPRTKYPTATYFQGIEFSDKKQSDKFFVAIEKIKAEDPTVELSERKATKQILLGGTSVTHLTSVANKLKSQYQINFNFVKVKVDYRETITKEGESEGRYVKQSGGAGYYGVVNMKFEPCDSNSFESKIFGGHIDKGYIPAVEKGFFEALEEGGLIGSPVINVKATLVDGKQHSVDSNEMAFKQAAKIAFKEAYMKCNPTILEPIYKLVINVPSDYIGSVFSDISAKRGRILDTAEDGNMNMDITCLVPESEIQDYSDELKQMTKSTGFYNQEFHGYEKCPQNIVEKIIKENKK